MQILIWLVNCVKYILRQRQELSIEEGLLVLPIFGFAGGVTSNKFDVKSYGNRGNLEANLDSAGVYT